MLNIGFEPENTDVCFSPDIPGGRFILTKDKTFALNYSSELRKAIIYCNLT